jgi:hypothetical protein
MRRECGDARVCIVCLRDVVTREWVWCVCFVFGRPLERPGTGGGSSTLPRCSPARSFSLAQLCWPLYTLCAPIYNKAMFAPSLEEIGGRPDGWEEGRLALLHVSALALPPPPSPLTSLSL